MGVTPTPESDAPSQPSTESDGSEDGFTEARPPFALHDPGDSFTENWGIVDAAGKYVCEVGVYSASTVLDLLNAGARAMRGAHPLTGTMNDREQHELAYASFDASSDEHEGDRDSYADGFVAALNTRATPSQPAPAPDALREVVREFEASTHRTCRVCQGTLRHIVAALTSPSTPATGTLTDLDERMRILFDRLTAEDRHRDAKVVEDAAYAIEALETDAVLRAPATGEPSDAPRREPEWICVNGHDNAWWRNFCHFCASTRPAADNPDSGGE